MMFRRLLLAGAAACLTVTTLPAFAQTQDSMTAPDYPETRRGDVVDTQFGEEIADPYRWLEDDVRNSAEVAQWVERENALTDTYLDALPARDWFEQRIGALYDFERFSTPVKAGERYFYTRNTGLQNQSPLYVRDGLNGEERLLLDPNEWADDGATALSGWDVSPSGRYLLYSVQDGGTDWRILRVMDVDTGEILEDEIRWAKFTALDWIGENGFVYSRFPEPAEGADFQALNYDQKIYYHKLGTAQDADEEVFATPDSPRLGHTAQVTDDGRWMIITSSEGTDDRYEVRAVDLASRGGNGWQVRELVTGFDNAWNLVNGIGDTLYFVTNKDAPLYKIVSTDMTQDTPVWQDVVAEQEQPIDSASLIADRLIVSYLRDASSTAMVYGLDGTQQREIEFAGLGSVGGFSGSPEDPEAFYAFTSFNRPSTIYRLNVNSGDTQIFAQPELAFDPDDYTVEQRFYASKDGTRVPMFIVRRNDIAEAGEAVPTLLYGYGGFNISVTPGFSASRMAWVQAGGAYAVANIRGGGEYGKAWHDGGRLDNKQNVFDDFIAAGEFLIAEGVTPEDGLAIQGGSNGGLLVGAVANQRPDLFAAGNAAVGVMDMLRFDR